MSRTFYSLLLRLVLPLQALRFWWRGWRHPVYRSSLRAHLSWGLTRRGDRPLWLHAASAGEVQALAGLLQQLREHHPSLPLLLTVGTPIGLLRARELYATWLHTTQADVAPALTVQPAPWDLSGGARRFLLACNPRMGVFVETELWPNLVRAATERRLPLLLVSARVSARSTARYQRWAAGLMRDTVRAFALIATQSAADSERFVSLGAEPARVRAAGNLKFDLPLPPDVAAQGAELRRRLAPQRPMWVAGSTHEGEEAMCLAAQWVLRHAARAAGRPAPLLLLAPRRPERFEAVAQWLIEQGAAWSRYALDGGISDATDVLLMDRFGELLICYAACDVCFVGGTLVPVGGHNLLEPAVLGKPVLAGPHCFNAPESARLLAAAGALREVEDGAGLAQALRQWLDDPSLAARAGNQGAAAVAANRGAAERTAQAITALLGSPAASPSAGG
jgi:3-deoxy-D-manno-octulosonic-acid transferase